METMSTEKRCAYATLVMINHKYVIGAITLAQSLKKTNTIYDIICMVTPDIDIKYTQLLSKYFTHIYTIPYVEIVTKSFRSEKRKQVYGSWINKSYTKLSVMNLDNYDKICWLDSDMIIINNIDHLFQLQTPVGIFSNHWFDHIKPNSNNINPKSCNFYSDIKTNQEIPYKLIHTALNNNGFVASGNLMVLTPNKKEFKEMIDMLKSKHVFGFNCASGGDEQGICYYQSIIKKRNWTCLKHGYNVIPWKLRETLHKQKPYIIHFNMVPKPWDSNKWIDTEIWWAYAYTIDDIHNICQILNITYDRIKHKECIFCSLLGVKNYHDILKCTNLIL